MTNDIEFYKDDFGNFRARSNEIHKYVTGFLEENVGGSIDACDFFINMVESVRDGLEEPGDGAGDAFGFYVDKNTIQLWHLWNGSDEKCTVDVNYFVNCLKAWRREIGG